MRTALIVVLLVCGLGVVPAAAETDPVGQWPLRPQPEVVADFDPPATTWGAGHRGVDLLGGAGQRVHAALAGRVSFVGTIAGRGVITVEHGDTRTTYEPVSAAVSVGEQVAAGAAIGRLAVLGSHCFPRSCLHWGWLRGDTYLDPLRLVGAGPVRLLPLAGLPTAHTPPALLATSRPIPTPYAGWGPLLRVLRPGVQP